MKNILFCFYFLISIICFSQSRTNLSPMNAFHSPTASSLGQFGDVPVSLYTGTPQINIPIYQLNERGVKLDINLEYNAKGVRVEDVPTWVGQNWNLNAGGLITRTVRGTSYDELNFFHGKNIEYNNANPYNIEWFTSDYYGLYQRGYYYHTEKLNNLDWNSVSSISNLALNSYFHTLNDYAKPKREFNWRMDLEPDLFTFNFFGHTGHFFLGQDGNWKVFSESNLKVLCNLEVDIDHMVPSFPGVTPGSPNYRFPKVINKIVLVDDNGTKFFFEQVELTFTNIFSHRPPFNIDSKCISTAFFITKVEDTHSNVLYLFEYDKGPWIGKFNISYEINHMYDTVHQDNNNTAISAFTPDWPWHHIGFGAPGQLILPSYLKKITTGSGLSIELNSVVVENALKYTRGMNPLFDNRDETYYGMTVGHNLKDFYFLTKKIDMVTDIPYTGQWNLWDRLNYKKLESIKIKDITGAKFNIDFNYIDSSGIRLFLDSVIFNGQKKYKLDYHSYYVPNFLSSETDHLGYYNGKSFKFTINQFDYNYWTKEIIDLKSTDKEYVKYGSLKKITYPSGGYTEFEFEPHKYSKRLNEYNKLVDEVGIIGGLRVKKIINYDDNNNYEIKEYQYTKSLTDTVSSGRLLYNPLYYKNSGIITHSLNNVLFNNRTLISSSLNSLVSMSNFMGVYVEYTDVIEKQIGNGYDHYMYTNYEEFPDIVAVSLHDKSLPFVPKTDNSFQRGRLSKKLTYNNSYQLLEKTEFEYFSDNSLKVNAININFPYTTDFVQPPTTIFWLLPFASAYQISYADRYITKETNYKFYLNNHNESNSFKSIRYTTLGATILNNGSIYKKLIYESSSEEDSGFLKTYTYSFEKNSDITNLMKSKNNFKVVEEKYEKILGDFENTNSNIIIEEKKIDFEKNGTTSNLILPKSQSIKKGDISDASTKKIIYHNYDYTGNLLEYQIENGITTALIWGYNQSLIIAKIDNTTYTEIQAQVANLQALSDTGTENQLKTALNTLRTSLPNAMVTTYTHKPLRGISTITDPRGRTTTYTYDDNNRLKEVRDHEGNLLNDYEYNYKQ